MTADVRAAELVDQEASARKVAWAYAEPLLQSTALLLQTLQDARCFSELGDNYRLRDVVEGAWNSVQAGPKDIPAMTFVLREAIQALDVVERRELDAEAMQRKVRQPNG